MSEILDVFCEVPCLTEQSVVLNGNTLQKKWFKGADRRIITQYLQKFIEYNLAAFRFLDVQPFIIGVDQNVGIAFRTSSFIGTIPLRAPDTGKQIGDFVVAPRFVGKDRFEDYIEILNFLGSEISPQIIDSLPLASGKNFRPPLYIESVKFIACLEVLLTKKWRKFDNTEKFAEQPSGQINWNRYVNSEFKIENRLRYPTRKNVLSEFHGEYSEIRFVFDLCKLELLSSNTPQKIKAKMTPQLTLIENRLYFHKPKAVNKIGVKASDTPAIKACKNQANVILTNNLTKSTAWKVDFSVVFERFVQYIFKDLAKETGNRLLTNFKFQKQSFNNSAWELKHVEPDAILQKEDLLIFIDAKYKSHLFNKFDLSELLKEDHRRDLHQIMAYTSFSKSVSKYGFLCYPSAKLEIKKMSYQNGLLNVTNTIFVLGLPLKKNTVSEAKKLLINLLKEIV